MIDKIIIEKYCSETNNFTLQVILKGTFDESSFKKIKAFKRCLEISDKCLLVRDQNIILHLYRNENMCLIANTLRISEGIRILEDIISLINSEKVLL